MLALAIGRDGPSVGMRSSARDIPGRVILTIVVEIIGDETLLRDGRALLSLLLVLLLAASPVASLGATNGIYLQHYLRSSAEYRSIVYVYSAIDI